MKKRNKQLKNLLPHRDKNVLLFDFETSSFEQTSTVKKSEAKILKATQTKDKKLHNLR